jgi:hypothetical protein
MTPAAAAVLRTIGTAILVGWMVATVLILAFGFSGDMVIVFVGVAGGWLTLTPRPRR